jgi:hypothetical protein
METRLSTNGFFGEGKFGTVPVTLDDGIKFLCTAKYRFPEGFEDWSGPLPVGVRKSLVWEVALGAARFVGPRWKPVASLRDIENDIAKWWKIRQEDGWVEFWSE